MRYAWRWLLAYLRLDPDAVCDMSIGRPAHADFHDYTDSTMGIPWHLHTHICKRCGKTFII